MIAKSLPLPPDSVDAAWGSDLNDRSLTGDSWHPQDQLMPEPTTLQQQPPSLEFRHFHLCDVPIPCFHTDSGTRGQHQDLPLSHPIFHGMDSYLYHPYTNDTYFTSASTTVGYATSAYSGNAEDNQQASPVVLSDIHASNHNNKNISSRQQKKNKNTKGEEKAPSKSRSLPAALETYVRDPQAHEELACGYAAFDSSPSSSSPSGNTTRGAEGSERHARRQRRIRRAISQAGARAGTKMPEIFPGILMRYETRHGRRDSNRD